MVGARRSRRYRPTYRYRRGHPSHCRQPSRAVAGQITAFALPQEAQLLGLAIMLGSVMNSVSSAFAAAGISLDIPTTLLIGGQWVESRAKRRFEVIDPSTGCIITSVADADA